MPRAAAAVDTYPLPKFDDFEDTLPDARPSGSIRVLLVEDDWVVRGLVSTRLVEAGYDVHHPQAIDDLAHAIEVLGRGSAMESFHLLILDHELRGLAGLEAVRRLRAAGWKGATLLLTTFPSAELRRRAEELKAAVLAKPFSLDLLTAAVDAALH